MKKTLFGLLLLVSIVLTACGGAALQNNTVSATEVQTVITTSDTQGKAVSLDLKDGPVLFIAHWCPYCQQYLKQYEPEPNMKVVAVYPMDGETEEQLREKAEALLEEAGWSGVPLYVSMDADFLEGVPSIGYVNRHGTAEFVSAFEWHELAKQQMAAPASETVPPKDKSL